MVMNFDSVFNITHSVNKFWIREDIIIPIIQLRNVSLLDLKVGTEFVSLVTQVILSLHHLPCMLIKRNFCILCINMCHQSYFPLKVKSSTCYIIAGCYGNYYGAVKEFRVKDRFLRCKYILMQL